MLRHPLLPHKRVPLGPVNDPSPMNPTAVEEVSVTSRGASDSGSLSGGRVTFVSNSRVSKKKLTGFPKIHFKSHKRTG